MKIKNYYSVYLGPQFKKEHTKKLIDENLLNYDCKVLELNENEIVELCSKKYQRVM